MKVYTDVTHLVLFILELVNHHHHHIAIIITIIIINITPLL